MMTKYKTNPDLEKCLPPLSDKMYQKIKDSIAKEGYDPAKPIVLWEEFPNTIVDGHHRYRACQELGVEPVAIEESFKSLDDALLYTLRRQTEQRELTAAQRTIVIEQMMTIEERFRLEKEANAAHMPNLKRGDVMPSPKPGESADFGKSSEVAQQIADKAGTNASTVYRVHAIQKRGGPEIKRPHIHERILHVGHAPYFGLESLHVILGSNDSGPTQSLLWSKGEVGSPLAH